MQQRNWLDLDRKLVDRYDLDYTVKAIQAAFGEAALSYWGEGVLDTTTYPNPFPISLSALVLGGTVGNGIAYDPNGLITRIDTGSVTSKDFVVPAANSMLGRWDLLVIRHKYVGDTPVPKPSDPIQTVPLNFHDEFELAVVPGTPSVNPAYPAKGAQDIVLAGLRVPAAAVVGTSIVVDYAPRERAVEALSNYPEFVQEVPSGTVDGVNDEFELSQMPLGDVQVWIDGLLAKPAQYSIIGKTITVVDPPRLAQDVEVFYLAYVPTNSQPISQINEVPTGAIDGVNDTFSLSGKPASIDSLLVTINGVKAKIGSYVFIQGDTDQIRFTSAAKPQPGQDLQVSYLVNTKTIGQAPASDSGSGGGSTPNPPPTGSAYDVQGGGNTPLIVGSGLAIPTSEAANQLKYLASAGGAQAVSANPQIAAGQANGQAQTLFGTSDIDYLRLVDGSGLDLNGPLDLKANSSLVVVWDSSRSVWKEISRR